MVIILMNTYHVIDQNTPRIGILDLLILRDGCVICPVIN